MTGTQVLPDTASGRNPPHGRHQLVRTMQRIKPALNPFRLWPLALAITLALGACAPGRYGGSGVSTYAPGRMHQGGIKDNKPSLWVSTHPRVAKFYAHYSRTKTVQKALLKGRRYLPTIRREFRARGLPLELAYLPMLESMFENRADSGSARGLWQFTRQTARHMGLRVGAFSDERLNWQKATRAAADYLDQLGKRFNYNWTLALAAYNGGPGYMEKAMKSQRTWDFFRLRVRKETAEYVPRFVAMVQVAKAKYPGMLMARR